MPPRSDTIAAIATAPGAAALGIVRISGPKSAEIIDVVVPKARASAKPRRVLAAKARHPVTGEPIDEVICFFCAGPHTSTGEDTAEIHGHGGRVVMGQLLRAVLDAGASVAEPGEFTYRAFQNGRLDLTQAEAVATLIGARSLKAAEVAFKQLGGGLGQAIRREFDNLVAISAEVEAGLDFPDEDLPLAASKRLALDLVAVRRRLKSMRDSFRLGLKLSEGAHVAIVGPPNAGKSSLLNCLVEQDRALIDPDPGTTRDVIDAAGEAGGIPLKFFDTAGLRQGAGRVEQAGIERSVTTARAADLVVVVLDGTEPPDTWEVPLNLPAGQHVVVALNKTDLAGWQEPTTLPGELADAPLVPISALTKAGIDALKQKMAELLGSEAASADQQILTTARQHEAVSSTIENIDRAAANLMRGLDPELTAADLHAAREELAELLGLEATEEVLRTIFSRFCIGK